VGPKRLAWRSTPIPAGDADATGAAVSPAIFVGHDGAPGSTTPIADCPSMRQHGPFQRPGSDHGDGPGQGTPRLAHRPWPPRWRIRRWWRPRFGRFSTARRSRSRAPRWRPATSASISSECNCPGRNARRLGAARQCRRPGNEPRADRDRTVNQTCGAGWHPAADW